MIRCGAPAGAIYVAAGVVTLLWLLCRFIEIPLLFIFALALAPTLTTPCAAFIKSYL